MVAFSGNALPDRVAGAVTCQLNRAQPPRFTLATEAGVLWPTVQPSGAASAAVTLLMASAGTCTVALAVNVWPGVTLSGVARATLVPGVGGSAYFAAS